MVLIGNCTVREVLMKNCTCVWRNIYNTARATHSRYYKYFTKHACNFSLILLEPCNFLYISMACLYISHVIILYQQENFEDMAQKFEESKNSTLHSNRPKSTYGNRSLSGNNKEERHHDRAHSTRDWVPKIVLVDSQKLESGSEFDSGSGVSADHYAQQYVKLGDRVLIEMVVEGKEMT